jgi:UDP-N-acetylmuramate--alanine ligase
VVQEAGLEGSVLVGSAVPSFGGRSTYVGGSRFFIAETCEYRRHFLSFHPDVLLVTSIEADHLDYYRDYEDVFDAFLTYGMQLPEAGVLVYCADDPGAASLAQRLGSQRPDLLLRPYGEQAGGAYRVRGARTERGRIRFLLGEEEGEEESEYALPVPGVHNALNAAAAVATLDALAERLGEGSDPLNPRDERDSAGTARSSTGTARIPRELLHRAFAGFRGTKRRSEVIGEASGVLFLDDYGHHPTAITKTLEALRAFYPGRRFIVDFMSHTYSRTAALLEEFAEAFGEADIVITHKIYASARESYSGSVTGERLAEAIARKHPRVYHFPEVMDAWQFCLDTFRPGDLFLTLGAGNNWTLGKALFESLSAAAQGSGTA